MSKVTKCMCEECHYNDNFKCRADGIEVRSSSQGNKVFTTDETCCGTFRNSGENPLGW